MSLKNKIRLQIAKWINVDLDKYENLKNDNRKLKSSIVEIDKEIKLQLSELVKPCDYKPEYERELQRHYPENITAVEAFNHAANTERLVYKQKLEYLKTLINK